MGYISKHLQLMMEHGDGQDSLRVVVKLKNNAEPGIHTLAASESLGIEAMRSAGLSANTLSQSTMMRVSPSGQSVSIETRVADVPDLAAGAGVDYVRPMRIHRCHLDQSAALLGVSAATPFTGKGIRVAVIDSGIDHNHPDLAGRVLPGWNFVAANAETNDRIGHGTQVAGVIAASAGNGAGGVGVTWSGSVMPLVVTRPGGQSTYSDLARAIIYATTHGARIINLSLGGTAPSDLLQDAIDFAWSHEVLVVAAAMNDGLQIPHYPAASTHALGITAYDRNAHLSAYSSYGPWVSFSAPGDDILTPSLEGKYKLGTGTSYATPIAAGVAALVLSVRPDLTASDLVGVLRAGAIADIPGVFTPDYGYGRINAARSIAAALSLPRAAGGSALFIQGTSPSTVVAGAPYLVACEYRIPLNCVSATSGGARCGHDHDVGSVSYFLCQPNASLGDFSNHCVTESARNPACPDSDNPAGSTYRYFVPPTDVPSPSPSDSTIGGDGPACMRHSDCAPGKYCFGRTPDGRPGKCS